MARDCRGEKIHLEYARKRKRTRREVFLAEMEQVVPWQELLALIEPHYPKAGRGRRPHPMASMLRIHLMQNWFGLSDRARVKHPFRVVKRQFGFRKVRFKRLLKNTAQVVPLFAVVEFVDPKFRTSPFNALFSERREQAGARFC